jgi:hypothetical protein
MTVQLIEDYNQLAAAFTRHGVLVSTVHPTR